MCRTSRPARMGGKSDEDAAQQLLADEQPNLFGVVHVPATGRADEREHEAGHVLSGRLEVDAGADPAGTLLPLEVRQQERADEVEDAVLLDRDQRPEKLARA